MRISDWSSDVCSSDLHPVDSEGAVIPPAFLDIGEQRDGDKPPAMVMRPDILVAAVEDMEEEGQKRRFGHGDAGEILAAVVAGECRSEERRVGKGCVGKCRSRGARNN